MSSKSKNRNASIYYYSQTNNQQTFLQSIDNLYSSHHAHTYSIKRYQQIILSQAFRRTISLQNVQHEQKHSHGLTLTP